MLAGEPPVTGASAQAMIAKLMTEKPTHAARLARHACPKAWTRPSPRRSPRRRPIGSRPRASSRAHSTRARTSRRRAARPGSEAPPPWSRGVAAVVVLGTAARIRDARNVRAPVCACVARTRRRSSPSRAASTCPRSRPTESSSRSSRAHCGAGGCTYSVVVQDVGGTTTRSILDERNGGVRAGVEPGPPQPDLQRHGRRPVRHLSRFRARRTAALSHPGRGVVLRRRRFVVARLRAAPRFGLYHGSGRPRRHPRTTASSFAAPARGWRVCRPYPARAGS